jgi:hypothetical protein
MSRTSEWQLYNELRETIEQVLEEFLYEQDLYIRPRLVISQDRYGDYNIYISEYEDTNVMESDDIYNFIIDGDIDYDAIDDLASQFVDLRL